MLPKSSDFVYRNRDCLTLVVRQPLIFISPARVILISPKGVSPACPKGSITRAFSTSLGGVILIGVIFSANICFSA